MRGKPCTLLLAAFLAAPGLPHALAAKSKKVTWSTGTVVATEIYGHGEPQAKQANGTKVKSRYGRKDLWWAYCIRSGEQAWSAVLRKKPAKCGLEVNAPVRYYISRDRLELVNSKGKRYSLRIIRHRSGEDCR